MIPTFLVLFIALTCCQVVLTVRVADWLSPTPNAGRDGAHPALADAPHPVRAEAAGLA